MARKRSARLLLAAASAVTLGASAVSSTGDALASVPGHTVKTSIVPALNTPNVQDHAVNAIYDAGTKIIAGGTFTTVQNRNSTAAVARQYLFAFDQATGQVDAAFAPVVNGDVRKIIAGPTAGTVFIAGSFSTVNGVTRKKVALLNVTDGSVVSTFKAPGFDGAVNDLATVGGRLLVGGVFTHAGSGTARGGLASVNATTGALDDYLSVKLTEHHNYDGGNGASAGIGVENLAVSPNGTHLVVIGNFRKADGDLHDQIVKLNLGGTSATIADWNTDRYTARCAYWSFDSWVRDVAYSPDGSYFVVVATGRAFKGSLCDAAARWEDAATGSGLQPTWVDYSGGDTFLSVAVSEQAVYTGGHFRWLNNTNGNDNATAGAVGRAGIAALDPATGLPLAWNPGRNPRGFGAGAMLVTADGVWVGSDTEYFGNRQYLRKRIAFLPLAGGVAPHSTATASLPGNVYLAGTTGDTLVKRAYDGVGKPGAPTTVTNPDGTAWSAVHGAFWVGGTLYYNRDDGIYQRSFDGTTPGTPSKVDPYHDAYWDSVQTGSGSNGQTYAGAFNSFYSGTANVTGMMFANGRMYYTLSNSSGLFWRWFNPDSGTLGTDKFMVGGAAAFGSSGGIFLSGGKLYVVNRQTGTLSTMPWVNGSPSGTPTVVSGPAVDGVDWRNKAVFVGP